MSLQTQVSMEDCGCKQTLDRRRRGGRGSLSFLPSGNPVATPLTAIKLLHQSFYLYWNKEFSWHRPSDWWETRNQLAATRGCFVPSWADIKWRERLRRFNHKQRDKIRTSVCTVSDGNRDMTSMSMCQNLQIRVQTELFFFCSHLLWLFMVKWSFKLYSIFLCTSSAYLILPLNNYTFGNPKCV